MLWLPVRGESGLTGTVPIVPLISILNERITTAALCELESGEGQESRKHLLELCNASGMGTLPWKDCFTEAIEWFQFDTAHIGKALAKYPDLKRVFECFARGMSIFLCCATG